MKYSFFLGALLLLTHLALGQQRWAIGGVTGTTVLQGDLSGSRFGDFDKMGVVAGGQLRYQFQPHFALRLQGVSGDLVGNDRNNRGIAFRTLFTEGSTLLEWHFLQHEYHTSRWSPYLGLGIGLIFFEPRVDFLTNRPEGSLPAGAEADIQADKGSPQWVIPGCLGFNFAMNDHWELGAEANLRASFSDYLDGVSQAANPEFSDWYLTTTLSLTYTWGVTDLDGDGVPDESDRCPDQFGSAKFQGCPDSDNDGIPDPDDACPNQSGYLDGCPDSDTDGVPDFIDQCPYRPGPPQQAGCPNTDTDADGVPDEEDKCPERPGPASRAGCPPEDIDHDGITDEHDQCPKIAGTRAHFGCPTLSPPEFYDFESLYFSEGAIQLNPTQQQYLREIASRLMAQPGQLLLLQGVATGAEGLEVARNRTEQAYNYLLSWGVSKSRINYGVYLITPQPGKETAARRVSLQFIKE
jgi:outer membrane protein OmpA-like peptidoglycan-associated protein